MMDIVSCTCAVFFLLGQNMLQNPGFESWYGGVPAQWSFDSGVALRPESGIVYEGYYSAQESLYTQDQTDADVYQGRFSVQPNIRYVFSLWVMDNDPAGQIRQAVYWYPSGSAWSSAYSHDTPAWQELTLEVLSPPDAESAFVVIRAYDNAAGWDGDAIFFLDDTEFSASDTQPPLVLRSWHIPVNPVPDTGITVYAWVTDDGTIVADTLFFGINGLSGLQGVTHASFYNDTCVFHIPQQTGGDTVLYFSKFADNEGMVCYSDTAACYVGATGVSINEMYYDADGTDTSCYIELFRAQGGQLDGFSIVGISGSSGSEYNLITLDGCSIPQDGFFVIAQDPAVPNSDTITGRANMQNGPDNVELRYHGITVDALGYGVLDGWHFTGEWLPACDVNSGHALGRYPDGHDTDCNAEDFHDYVSRTPGTANPIAAVHEMTPARAGMPHCIVCRALIPVLPEDERLYPVTVYNALGQQVQRIRHPRMRVTLTAGVYFMRWGQPGIPAWKMVVVD